MFSEQPPTWFVYSALFFAMCTCASAAVVFTQLIQLGVPPALASSYRLAWVDVLQIAPFLLTLQKAQRQDREQEIVQHWANEGTALIAEDAQSGEPPKVVAKSELLVPRIIKAIPFVALSGCCLGIHFSSWTYSLRDTSLTHSLLWVSMGPIIINGGTWITYLVGLMNSAPTWIETLGTAVGLIGALIMLLDIRDDPTNMHSPTLKGDLIALLGAAAVSVYLVVGQHLRAWMPLWVYAFGVVFFAYLTSLCLAFAAGELDRPAPVLGMFQLPFLWYSLYLGAGPGIAGHTLLNYLVKYVSPLTISTAMLSEPLVGSVMGCMAGMQPIPGAYTWLGGVVLLCGLFAILYGESKKDSISPQLDQ